MALVVEDGTGSTPAANSYVSLSDADAYFAATDRAAWTAASQSDREKHLRVGCRYLEDAYRGRWVGYKVAQEQPLAWPRIAAPPYSGVQDGLYDLDGFLIEANQIPAAVKQANYEAAYASLTGATLTSSQEGSLAAIMKKVGEVTIRKEFASAASSRTVSQLTIDDLLRGLLTTTPGASFGQLRMVRG